MRISMSEAARRAGWLGITLSVLAVLAIVGTVATIVLRDDAPVATSDTAVPTLPASSRGSSVPGTVAPSSSPRVLLPGSSPTDSVLAGGQTNHLVFAGLVAEALFSYDEKTDFAGRNDDLLSAAAPAPMGDPAGLTDDLTRYTPVGATLASIRDLHTSVTFTPTQVSVSEWARRKLDAIDARTGVYGVDVTGRQTILSAGGAPISVSVQLGVTVACPPATGFCTIDRIFPQHLQEALGTG